MDNPIAIFIIIALFALWNIDFLSSLFNLKALDPHLPDEFRGVYDEDKYTKSQEYTRVSERYGIITSTYSLTILLVFWSLGGFGWLDEWLRGFGWSETLTGLAYIGSLMIGKTLLSLPFSIYDTFVIEELEINDVSQGKGDAGEHAGNGTFLIDLLGKDSHQQRWEEGGCSQTESKGNGLGNECGWRINSKVGSHTKRDKGCHARIIDFFFIRKLRFDDFFHQVVGDGSREHEQKPCCG